MSAGGNSKREMSREHMTVKQRWILTVCLMAAFFPAFMGSSLNLSITDISDGFRSGATTVTWVVNAYAITMAALSLPFGHLSDISDRSRLFLLGSTGFSLSCALCVFVPGIGVLIMLRVLQSACASLMFAANVPLLLSCFPPEQRGRLLGYSVTAIYLGLSLGPVFGGLLNSVFGWRSIFAVAALLSLIAVLIARKHMDPDPHPQPIKADPGGNIIYIAMILCLMLGLSCWSSGWWSKALTLVSLPLLYFLIRHELKVDQPVLPVRLFAHDRAFILINVATLLNYGATFAVSYTLSLYLQNVQQLDSSLAGLVLVSQPLLQAMISPLAGRLSERIAPGKLASLGMLIISIALFLLSRLTEHTSLPLLVLNLMLMGVGFGFFSSPNSNAALSCVDRNHYGEANSILSTMRSVGHSISMVTVMFLLGAFVGNVVVTEASPMALTSAINMVMRVSCGICLVGTAISLAGSKPLHQTPPTTAGGGA